MIYTRHGFGFDPAELVINIAGLIMTTEEIVITEEELQEMSMEEMALLSRLIAEPPKYRNLSFWSRQEFSRTMIGIRADVPCITTLP